MKKFILILTLFLSLMSFADNKISFFGEDDYRALLDKYSQKIEEHTFKSDELINEIKDIHSQLILKLLDDLKEMLKVKRFFSKEMEYSNDIEKIKENKSFSVLVNISPFFKLTRKYELLTIPVFSLKTPFSKFSYENFLILG